MEGSSAAGTGDTAASPAREQSARRRARMSCPPGLPGAMSASALVAALVHEVRTPVTALATGSELLLDDLEVLSHEECRRILLTMRRGALWLQGLVENLLCAATLAEGQLRIYPRAVSLAEIARDVAPVVEPLMRQRSQQLRIVERGAAANVFADGRRVAQAVINLLTNASKFSGPGTRIDLTVAPRGERVRLTVADRGPGLPADGVRQLFAPFVRADEAGRAGIDGAGLGLAIVKSIVDLHGGRVGAARRRSGGARFWIELPVAAEAGPPIAAPAVAVDLAVTNLSVRERLA